LTSQSKSGKTTLVAALLARLKEGGTFAGLGLRPGKAVIISEESTFLWNQRSAKLGFGDQLCWFCRPFAGRPGRDDWQALQDAILRLHDRHRFDLIVIDPLIEFLPCGSENSAVGVTDFLRSLRRFTAAGMADMILHHPRKGRVLEGQAARGSSALTGFADVVMEQNFYKPGDDTDRRRRIRTYSRLEQTPRRLVLELNADATDYTNHGDFEVDEFMQSWRHVRVVLQGEDAKMTRKEILENWPPDFPAPVTTTLARWLERALDLGLVKKLGQGSKSSPFQYWLPERESDDWFHYFNQMERAIDECNLILTGLGYFPPFQGVPKDVKAEAEREAELRVWGPGGLAAFTWKPVQASAPVNPTATPEPAAAPDPAATLPAAPVAAPNETSLAAAPLTTGGAREQAPPQSTAPKPPSPSVSTLPAEVHPSYLRSH